MICVLLSIALVVLAPATQCKSVEKRGIPDVGGESDDSMQTLFESKRDAPILGGGVSAGESPMIIGQEDGGSMGREVPSVFDQNIFDKSKLAGLKKLATRDEEPEEIVTCVYCDKRCVDKAKASGFDGAKSYFSKTIEEMNSIVEKLDPSIQFKLKFVLQPGKDTEMQWFFNYNAKTSEELLKGVNDKFWIDTGLYSMANNNGCDLDYFEVSNADQGWKYMGSVAGIANMFQMCLNSYSTVLMSANHKSLAKLMVHEWGHMVGIYHDGLVNKAFTKKGAPEAFDEGGAYSHCKSQYGILINKCTASSVGCLGSDCIMASTVDGTSWSDCSKAYYKMYLCLTEIDDLKAYYDKTCIGSL